MLAFVAHLWDQDGHGAQQAKEEQGSWQEQVVKAKGHTLLDKDAVSHVTGVVTLHPAVVDLGQGAWLSKLKENLSSELRWWRPKYIIRSWAL